MSVDSFLTFPNPPFLKDLGLANRGVFQEPSPPPAVGEDVYLSFCLD
jgi:hypothetical protein